MDLEFTHTPAATYSRPDTYDSDRIDITYQVATDDCAEDPRTGNDPEHTVLYVFRGPRGAREATPEHPVADGDVGDPLADGEHVAADLDARDEGRLRPYLVLTTAHEGVGEVHRARPHRDVHLAGARLGGRGVDEGEDVSGVAELLDLPRTNAHGKGGYRSHTSGLRSVHGT